MFILNIASYLPDRFQCLLPLTTTPIVVLFGDGASYREAQVEAARSALRYLKVMTKRIPHNPNEVA